MGLATATLAAAEDGPSLAVYLVVGIGVFFVLAALFGRGKSK